MLDEFQCHLSSFGIGKTEGEDRNEESMEGSINKTMLAKTLNIPMPAHYYSYSYDLYPVPIMERLAINGEASLIFHPAGRKQAPV